MLDTLILLGFEDLALKRKRDDHVDKAGRGSYDDVDGVRVPRDDDVPNGSLIARKFEVEHAVRHVKHFRKQEFKKWRSDAEK